VTTGPSLLWNNRSRRYKPSRRTFVYLAEYDIRSPLFHLAYEKLIPAPKWIFLAVAWLTLAAGLANWEFPLRFKILIVILFFAFSFIVFYASILSFLE
jgi:hypothetical protein